MIFASPTPHSLRHSFAVNTLKRIKERGDCPQHALPVLATYMGHHIYQYTAKYLKFIDAEQRQSLFDFARSKMENI
jgi:integrase/recombinase XerD